MLTYCVVLRELRELESCKKDDERHTAQLNKMVHSLEDKLETCKYSLLIIIHRYKMIFIPGVSYQKLNN